ncbi:MAG: ThiF family adenylyltransferase [bacterium]|nr:ThiF family adenylyltransferase [bacterium]
MSYLVDVNFDKVVLVGCGGTGSLILEGLCRQLIGTPFNLILVDMDKVEPHNLGRQNFYKEDLGKFKSQVLAERYSKLYNRPIGYSVSPFGPDMMGSSSQGGDYQQRLIINSLIIGAVDNFMARQEMAKACEHGLNWWIDAGNGYNSGQVLIGNVISADVLRSSFQHRDNIMLKCPAPSLQSPALLLPSSNVEGPRQDCAEAVRDESQSPVINQAMATLALDMLWRIALAKLDYIGAYIDLDAGVMRRVPAEPAIISRMFGIPEDDLGQICNPAYSLRGAE